MPPDALKLFVQTADGTVREFPLDAPLEIGRQRADEVQHSLFALVPSGGLGRLFIAPNDEKNIGRTHAVLEPLAAGTVRVSNRSQVPLPRLPGEPLAANAAAEMTPPFQLFLPGRTLLVSAGGSLDELGLQGLDQMTVGPGSASSPPHALRPPPALSLSQINDLVRWLQPTVGVLQATVGSSDFLLKAAESLVQRIGLQSGRVLLFQDEQCKAVAQYPPALYQQAEWTPSKHVLAHVRSEKRTFWKSPQQPSDAASLPPQSAVVAAPLLDRHGNVIGALYGERLENSAPTGPVSGRLEALLVDLLAGAVSSGLARQEQERSALEVSIRFEQFFTHELAEELARDPGLLKGADRTVTLLFCDVRGFSGFSEKLGPDMTMDWMNDVMGTLSECVLRENGVLVDYIGDEMLAMWGAPKDQDDQAERAARAGLAMLESLPRLNQRWTPTLGKDMGIGVGINTGTARVGNTGSRFKFKYGPLGNTVNLASRVQGLTKYLGCPLLVTKATRERLGDSFIARRVVKTRVVNINEPVDLFEIERCGDEGRKEFFQGSEAALEALEDRDFADAARRSGALLPVHSGDGPLTLILARASGALVQRGTGFDPVWEPPGK